MFTEAELLERRHQYFSKYDKFEKPKRVKKVKKD